MTHNTQISVVIPLYNKERHIDSAIQSVLNQSYQSFELIIVDDGSTDGGGVKIQKYLSDSRISIIHQENGGVATARNNGISVAKNEVVAFLDADDEWEPDFLENIVTLYHLYPNSGLYATGFNLNSNDVIYSSSITGVPAYPWHGIIDYFKIYSKSGTSPISASSVALKKSLFESIGGFNEKLTRSEDIELWGRIILSGNDVAYSSYVGASIHMDADNKSTHVFKPYATHPLVLYIRNLVDSGKFRLNNQYIESVIELMELEAAFVNIGAKNKKQALKNLASVTSKKLLLKKYILRLLIWLPFNIGSFGPTAYKKMQNNPHIAKIIRDIMCSFWLFSYVLINIFVFLFIVVF